MKHFIKTCKRVNNVWTTISFLNLVHVLKCIMFDKQAEMAPGKMLSVLCDGGVYKVNRLWPYIVEHQSISHLNISISQYK